jgi:hypothetical protein
MQYKPIGHDQLDAALTLLSEVMLFDAGEPIHLVVCGGSALIATQLVLRTTRDIDVLAIYNGKTLVAPVPLPERLCRAAENVKSALNLPENWLNNGPSSNNGGLFQMGLPEGLETRIITKTYGSMLTVSFIGRKDQIFFKLWASVDRGGYHIDDLLKLNPTADELVAAAEWIMQKDVSDGFRTVLLHGLEQLGFPDVVKRIA